MPKTAKTPGSVLQSLIDDYKLTPAAVAKDLKVKGLGSVLSNKEGITLDLAMRLAKYFGTPVEFWVNLQLSAYKKSLAAEVKGIPKAKKPKAEKAASAGGKKAGRKPAADKKTAGKKPAARGRGRKAAADKAPAKTPKPRAPRGSKKSAASRADVPAANSENQSSLSF